MSVDLREHMAIPGTKLRVGFIGIGATGTPISHNMKAGFPLTVYDRFPAQTDLFAALGVPVGSSCSDVARKPSSCSP